MLLEQLRPSPGLRFDGAVATTFTLDLTATLVPALAFSSQTFAGPNPDPVATLESIRATAARMDVFCQAGNISVPRQSADLMAFLEPMVHEVEPPGRGGLFHPKCWFVRYVDEVGTASYRLLVLTRNLTNDSSWDIAVRLDSESVATRPLDSNRGLTDFLSSLSARSVRPLPAARANRIAELAQAAERIVWELPQTVEQLSFHYLDGRSDTSMDLRGSRHLVVSPFINDAGIALMRSDRPITVLSRAEELDRLPPDALADLDLYVVDTMAGIDDPSSEGDDIAGSLLGRLHAKMYVIEPRQQWSKARVVIGSANATDAGFERNVELLVELYGHRRHLGIDTFLGPDAEFRQLVEPYATDGGASHDPTEDEQRKAENQLRAIATIPHVVTVEPSRSEARPADGSGSPAERLYALVVISQTPYRLPEGWSVDLELLTLSGQTQRPETGRTVDVTFADVATADVTPFLVVRLHTETGLTVDTVLVADLVGDPSDRLDVVLARQIDTPEKFLRFLYLLLSLGDPHLLAQLASGDGTSDGFGLGSGGVPGVLELVLRALADRPAALVDLDRLVRRLRATEKGRALLPDGFDALWIVVDEARTRLGATDV